MKRRLLATFHNDIRLQWRNGFYLATAVITLLFALLLRTLPQAAAGRLLPALIVNNLIVNGFYFISGLVLLEKGEGTLQVQVVTPLRSSEYLAAKAGSLTLLSLLENGLLLLAIVGSELSLLWLLVAISAGTLFYLFSGFIFVSRYQSIGEFLLPSLPVVTALALPLLPYFVPGQYPVIDLLVYAHPLQPILLLLQAALATTSTTSGQLLFATVAALVWSGFSFVAAKGAYRRFVAGEGTIARSAGEAE